MAKQFTARDNNEFKIIKDQMEIHQQAANYIIIKKLWSHFYKTANKGNEKFKDVFMAFSIPKNSYYSLIKLRELELYTKNIKKMHDRTGIHEKYFDGSQLFKISDDKDFDWWIKYFVLIYKLKINSDEEDIKSELKKMNEEISKDIKAVLEKQKRGYDIDTDIKMLIYYILHSSVIGASSIKIQAALASNKAIEFSDFAEAVLYNQRLVEEFHELLEKQLDMVTALIKVKNYKKD